jgi:transposase InsO family protein/ribonuclease HI
VNCCASGFPFYSAQPTIKVRVNGRTATALVDSGCSRSIVSPWLVRSQELLRTSEQIIMMNGEQIQCNASCVALVGTEEREVRLGCLVVSILPGVDMLLGMDGIVAFGGVTISETGKVEFNSKKEQITCVGQSTSLQIEDTDFSAIFFNGKWTVKWKWKEETRDPELSNTQTHYAMKPEVRAEFEKEIEDWIRDGWLQPYSGQRKGLVPLMAVVQDNKAKVRPVMDFREMNQHVSSHTAESDVCLEKIRKWRQLGTNLKVVDLRKAYLQIHVDPSLWPYQVVIYKGKTYCLTRLGFGLSVAPKIMTAILHKVLEQDEKVRKGTDSYIDDIIVNESIVSSECVVNLLRRYGLETKPPENLNGSRVLGLKVKKTANENWEWTRDNQIRWEEQKVPTKREVFSVCGQLIGHLPVAGWLRPACSFIKRSAGDGPWDEPVNTRTADLLKEVLSEVEGEDPAKGTWAVDTKFGGKVWCDASSLAMGVSVQIGNTIVEDAAWLRKKKDMAHINLAELDAVMKGVSLAVKWDLKKIEIVTDSATVFGWVKSVITKEKRIKVHGMSEPLVYRRIGLLADIFKEYDLMVTISLVRSHENKADRLTRVPKRWLNVRTACVAVSTDERVREITKIHELHHLGVRKTKYVIQRMRPGLRPTNEEVKTVINRCQECASIDPAPVKYEKGELEVAGVWTRLACDVTHYREKKYVTIVDCGPSRFAIWKAIKNEESEEIIRVFEGIFYERGVPAELLMDNSTTFHSRSVRFLCEKWGVRLRYRCAYRPQGNGIVERNHRTIKRMAARTGKSIEEMVFWYNCTPRSKNPRIRPCQGVFTYDWRCPGENVELESPSSSSCKQSTWEVGEEVYVKPEGVRCTSQWGHGVVTKQGECCGGVEVNGVRRHVTDVRKKPVEVEEEAEEDGSCREEEDETEGFGREEAETITEGILERMPDGNREQMLNEEWRNVRRTGRICKPPQRYGFGDL